MCIDSTEIIETSLSEPHTSESNNVISYNIFVIRISYVCLDCNLTQPHVPCSLYFCSANYFPAQAVPFQNEHSFTNYG